MNETKPIKRCAIYCRKSTEDGLEQDYNTLDAQRVSCEHYIAIQEANGWVALEKHYDDGGFSGGNTQRPALQELLKDIEEGKVDVVVVYKIDRLSRSIVDFAGLQEIFNKHNVAFVASTQQIDTSTSHGCMFLNILMTFAQFERDIIRERIRDKMSSSRKQGIWVGGTVPFGYMLKDKKLVPHPRDAQTLRYVFSRYMEIGSARQVVDELTTSQTIGPKGHTQWKYNSLYRILTSPTYIGKVAYKGEIYEGQHEALIPEKLWDEVQGALASRTVIRRATEKSIAMLGGGLMRCKHCGRPMIPTFSMYRNTGKRYPYYYCSSRDKEKPRTCPLKRLPAHTIDTVVEKHLRAFLGKGAFHALLCNEGMGNEAIENAMKNQSAIWDSFTTAEKQHFASLLIERIEVDEDGLDIVFRSEGMEQFTTEMAQLPEDSTATAERLPNGSLRIHEPYKIRRISGRRALIRPINPDELEQSAYWQVLRAIAKARHWRELLRKGRCRSVGELADLTSTNERYVRRNIALAYLAPPIIAKLLECAESGKDSEIKEVTIAKLCEVAKLTFPEQLKELGIA